MASSFGWDFIRGTDNFKEMSNSDQEKLARRFFEQNLADDLTGDDLESAFNTWKETNLPTPTDSEGNVVDRVTPEANIVDPNIDMQKVKEAAKRNVGILKETGKVGLQALTNVANTPTELANVGRVGYNKVTGDNVQPFENQFELPEDLKPTTETGKMAADVLPMFIPSKAGASVLGKLAKPAEYMNKTVRAASGSTESPTVESFIPEAEKAIQENPEKYSGMSVEDVALNLRDAKWTGSKAQQAVLGSTLKAGTLAVPERAIGSSTVAKLVNSAGGKATQVGLATGGSELAKQTAESAVSGEDRFNVDDVATQTGLGVGIGALFNLAAPATRQAGKAIKPGNEERVQRLSDALDSEAQKRGNLAIKEEQFGTANSNLQRAEEAFNAGAIDEAQLATARSQSQRATGELYNAQADATSPVTGLASLLKSSPRVIAQDVQQLSPAQRDALGMGFIPRTISQFGSHFDSAIVSSASKAAKESAVKDIKTNAINDLRAMRQELIDGGAVTESNTVTKLITSLEKNKPLADDALEEMSRLGNTARSEQFASTLGNPSEVYHRAREATKEINNSTSGFLDNDVVRAALSVGSGIASGGTTTIAQTGLTAAKQAVDRAALNDVRRASGEVLRGDATRQAVGDALTNTANVLEPFLNRAAPLTANAAERVGVATPIEQPQTQPSTPSQDEVLDVGSIQGIPSDDSPIDINEIQGIPDVDASEVQGIPEDEPKVDRSVAGKLYEAFSKAETGGEKDPWIRTRAQDPSSDLHSSAYGPAQITYSLAESYLNNRPELFTEQEIRYLNAFVNQGRLMIAASNGYVNDPKLQYGGSGYLNGKKGKEMYESVAKKMLVDTFRRNDGNLAKTVVAWRGLDDPSYADKVARNIP